MEKLRLRETNDTPKPPRVSNGQRGPTPAAPGRCPSAPSRPAVQEGSRDCGPFARDTRPDCHCHNWEADACRRLLSDFSQWVNEERLLPPEPPAHFVPRGCPAPRGSVRVTAASCPLHPQGDQRCFSDTLGTFPTCLSQNHQMARPQESACLKESHPLFHCPHSGPRGSLGTRFTRQLLYLITRKSVPLPSALRAPTAGVGAANFSATPHFLQIRG